ncbi:MAG: universal stress protein [Flavisolibacter sp.]
MKNILVPTDFSFFAQGALNYAVQLSKWSGARVTLVHVYDFLSYHFHDRLRTLIVEHNEKTRTELALRLQTVKEQVFAEEGITIHTKLYNGAVITGIDEAADEAAADLIVMGTLGVSGLREKLMGSKTLALLRKSQLPVMVIPPDYTWQPPRLISIALKNEVDIHLLDPVFEIADIFSSSVNAVMFKPEEEGAIEVIRATRTGQLLLEKMKKHYHREIALMQLPSDNFIRNSTDYIRKEEVDLFVMIMRHDSWVNYFLGNSMTQKMAAHPIVPILALSAE